MQDCTCWTFRIGYFRSSGGRALRDVPVANIGQSAHLKRPTGAVPDDPEAPIAEIERELVAEFQRTSEQRLIRLLVRSGDDRTQEMRLSAARSSVTSLIDSLRQKLVIGREVFSHLVQS